VAGSLTVGVTSPMLYEAVAPPVVDALSTSAFGPLNSAQVMRLLNACLYEKGGALKAESTGRGDCTEIVIRSRRTNEPQVILPCYGDRIFGMTADDEMAFTFPFAMADAVVKGLEGTHAGGVRYPIPVYLRYQAEFPKSYQELEKLWAEGK